MARAVRRGNPCIWADPGLDRAGPGVMTAFAAAQPLARIAAVVIADAEQPDGRSLAGPPASTISVTDGSVTVIAVEADVATVTG